MIFAADYGANCFVLAGLEWRDQRKILRAQLEQQVPAVHLTAIFRAQQRETVDGPVAIPRFSLASRHPENEWLTGFYPDFRRTLTGNPVAAVAICGQLDDSRLCEADACSRQHEGSHQKSGPLTSEPGHTPRSITASCR